MSETTFYLMYPVRKSKLGYKKMRIFYVFLGFLWIVAAVYLYLDNPTGKIWLPVVYLVIGLIMEVMAYFYPIVILGRFITVSEKKCHIYLSPFQNVTFGWDEVLSVSLNKDKSVLFDFASGRKSQFRLKKLDNRQWKLLQNKLIEVLKQKEVTVH